MADTPTDAQAAEAARKQAEADQKKADAEAKEAAKKQAEARVTELAKPNRYIVDGNIVDPNGKVIIAAE